MFCEKIVEGLLIVDGLEAFCTNLQGVCVSVCLSVCVCESECVSEWGWVGVCGCFEIISDLFLRQLVVHILT